jgi:hypothetical protein
MTHRRRRLPPRAQGRGVVGFHLLLDLLAGRQQLQLPRRRWRQLRRMRPPRGRCDLLLTRRARNALGTATQYTHINDSPAPPPAAPSPPCLRPALPGPIPPPSTTPTPADPHPPAPVPAPAPGRMRSSPAPVAVRGCALAATLQQLLLHPGPRPRRGPHPRRQQDAAPPDPPPPATSPAGPTPAPPVRAVFHPQFRDKNSVT